MRREGAMTISKNWAAKSVRATKGDKAAKGDTRGILFHRGSFSELSGKISGGLT